MAPLYKSDRRQRAATSVPVVICAFTVILRLHNTAITYDVQCSLVFRCSYGIHDHVSKYEVLVKIEIPAFRSDNTSIVGVAFISHNSLI